ncbi:MAG: DUF29 family protein [Microcystis sp. LE19-55.1A]|uniref:DUF29 family protein n=1 Tax=Microcystis sp. TaxID=1127 RepID=UPI0022C93107|nr:MULTISPECIES: DUF29 family protein [unclassified Microcystis]MCZ8202938.1 DUF29 family protein [Microcystis sp. LE19-55.1A]MCZ8307350.1 DUF29 family protein [Microcystis sp. LE19-98.1E]
MIDNKSAAQSQKSMQLEELKQLYDQDFVLWIERTTEQIRRGEMKNLDWEHLLTEIEDLGREQRNQVESYLIQTVKHLGSTEPVMQNYQQLMLVKLVQ